MQEGLVTLRQNGWKAILDGLTTPEEVLNASEKDPLESVYQSQDEEKKVSLEDIDHLDDQLQKNKSSNGQYEARIYPRTYHPIEVKFRVLKHDPQNPNKLLADSEEYQTVTKDFSAGGLRFLSKELLAVGSLLELKIKLGADQDSIECLGKICRVEEDNLENIFTIITYYLDLSSAERVLINKFVEQVN
jgi:hypothetical protein